MKGVFRSIAAVLGFSVMAACVIYFAETGTLFNFPLSPSLLSANVDSVTSPDAAPQAASIAAAAQDSGSIGTAASSTSASVPPSPSSSTSSNALDSSASASTSPAPAPESTLEPTSASDYPSTSTEATATIIVSPTAPTPPPAPPQIAATQNEPSAAPLYHQTDFSNDADWRIIWGAKNITQSGAMDLAAKSDSTGGSLYLAPSIGWSNYTFSATVDWVAGGSFELLANYRDASNYMFCNFKNDDGGVTMQVEDYENGVNIALSPIVSVSVPISAPIPVSAGADATHDIPVSISVGGLYATCSFNNQIVTNSGVGQGRTALAAPLTGGIGFSVNDRAPGTASVIVKSVDVVQK